MKTLKITLALLLLSTIGYSQIAYDKQMHLLAGAGVGFITYTVVLETTHSTKKAFWYSLGATVVTGICKELVDEHRYHGFSSEDIVATTLGGLTMSFTINLFHKEQKKQIAKLY